MSVAVGAAQAADVAWISFHPADNTPSAAAMTAGATVAVDKGYTDLLLGAGHAVTRFVSSDAPDTATLNTFDLVVISRSVGSGNYELDAETAAWNGITAPTMILGGYVLRNNRLGYTTGTTIPDTGGPIKLLAALPNHPIFAGVALDGTNTMVDDYTLGLPLFNGVAERGISVNTNPIVAGGTVIATVNTAGDPANSGMIISEFPTGTTMSTTPADVLGGPRLVFLTGGRETNGVSAETAGVFDLSATGAQLFLNAAAYMGGPSLQPGDVDGDGDVDMADFDPIRNHFQQLVATRADGDLNADGQVDWVDFRQWKSNHPFTPPPAEAAGGAVPEPAAAGMGLVAVIALCGARRSGRRGNAGA